MGKDRQAAGFTMIEMVVVAGILVVLASIILPNFLAARNNARLAQCTNNLRQIGLALVMYNLDHGHQMETYPDRLTHLYGRTTWPTGQTTLQGYVADPRVFICPMDYTKAGGNKSYPTTLKTRPSGVQLCRMGRAQLYHGLIHWPKRDDPDWRRELFVSL